MSEETKKTPQAEEPAVEHVSVRMISQSCDEINIIIGVEEKDFDLAIRTI